MSEGATGVRLLAQQLGKVPVELQRQLRPAIREAGDEVKAAAAANASWSSRIPSSLKVRASFAGKRAGVYVAASAKLAPHARAYEGISGNGRTFRHPLFGDYDHSWFAQATRPFLRRAMEAKGPAVVAKVEAAIDHAAAEAGFR